MDDPLLNPLILSNIFKHLPHDGKKRFRQVSQLWEDSTLQSWRDNAVVRIVMNKYVRNSQGVTFKEFMELLKEKPEEPYRFSEDKPFRSFQLSDCPFYELYCPETKEMEDEDESRALVKSVFEKIGPTIHHLHLDSSVRIRTGRFIDAFKWILLKTCVNLKEIHFDSSVYRDRDRPEPVFQPGEFVQERALHLVTLKLALAGFARGWKPVSEEEAREMWNIIPNLKNLDLNKTSGGLDLVKQLKHPLDSGKFIKLERLKLQTYDVAQIVEITSYILVANPPLTRMYLKLNLSVIRSAQESFKAFLESCKDTLTSLCLLLNEQYVNSQQGPQDWIVEFSGVTLPQLTCLYLQYQSSFDSDNEEKVGSGNGTKSFDFGALQGFPKLKKFSYGYNLTENFVVSRKWLTEGKLQYRNAEEHAYGDDYRGNEGMEDFAFWSFQKFDCNSLKKLAGWMSSIKYLAVDADEATLPVILKSFPKLKRLSLLDGSSVFGGTLQEVNKTYPGIEIDMLGFYQSLQKFKMPEYF